MTRGDGKGRRTDHQRLAALLNCHLELLAGQLLHEVVLDHLLRRARLATISPARCRHAGSPPALSNREASAWREERIRAGPPALLLPGCGPRPEGPQPARNGRGAQHRHI